MKTSLSDPIEHKFSPRIEVADALRGFALVIIFLYHFQVHFMCRMHGQVTNPFWKGVEEGIYGMFYFLFDGKTYTLFAILFGFTYFLQYNNQVKKGRDFAGRFAWRLAMLIPFALLNASFFPAGDILLSFCITGLFLIPARKWSALGVGVFALIFLLQPLEWYRYFNTVYAWGLPEFQLMGGYGYGVVDKTTRAGEFFPMVWNNITAGEYASLTNLWNRGRIVQTVGLFLLGLAIGKGKYFEMNEANRTFWTKGVLFGLAAVLALYALRQAGELSGQISHIFFLWYNTWMSILVMSLFVLLYQGAYFQKVTRFMNYYGKMSLTMYVSQSILASLVLFPYALNLASTLNKLQSGLMCMAIIALQVYFCRWWLARFRYGPLEYLWHKLTWIGSPKK